MMKQAVRAVVIREGYLLVMHRNKFGQQYYTLVGGGVGVSETPEQALYRELHEETGIQIANPRLVFLEDSGDMYGLQHVFLCEYTGGEVALRPDSDEAQINALGQNTYTPGWLPLAQLPSVQFVTPNLRQHLLDAVRDGWPEQPLQFKSDV